MPGSRGQWHHTQDPVRGPMARAFTRATGYEIRRRRPSAVLPVNPTVPTTVPTTAPRRNPLAEPPLRQHTEDSLAELLERRRASGDRLVVSPTFILSSVRSGSTLLRVMLNSHSRIHSPHELHLRNIRVGLTSTYVEGAMTELGLDARELKYLLWDRLLNREVTRRGKDVLVNKTPSDAFIWRALIDCWPDAKFIFLLRHPGAVVNSWNLARSYWTREETAEDVLKYVAAVEQARIEHGGLTVRYEDITSNPEKEMRRICGFLGLEWESGMLNYGDVDHGRFKPGLGDWSPTIRTGRVQPARSLPADDTVPEILRPISTAWGYVAEQPTYFTRAIESVSA